MFAVAGPVARPEKSLSRSSQAGALVTQVERIKCGQLPRRCQMPMPGPWRVTEGTDCRQLMAQAPIIRDFEANGNRPRSYGSIDHVEPNHNILTHDGEMLTFRPPH